MQLTATLSPPELRALITELLPLEIDLDGAKGERLLVFDTLSELTFVGGQGIRVKLAGKMVWPVLGLDVPIRIRSLQVLVRLEREKRPSANLVIRVFVEDADLAWVPGAVDESIAERVNNEIRERDFELAWDYEKLLTHRFELPAALRTSESLRLLVRASEFHVTGDEMQLTLSLGANVQPRPLRPSDP